MKTGRRYVLGVGVAVALGCSACSTPTYVNDTEEPRLDDYTMSLQFERRDIERLYNENIEKMLGSSIAKRWERQSASMNPSDRPVVAIFPMRNETSEHIGPQLDTLLAQFETDLVNRSPVSVVSHENQPELIDEVRRQQSSAYDPQRLARYGRQLGAQYFITGKVFDVRNQIEDEVRVQYSMFVQVINVETGEVEFQNAAALTKGLVR